ncbi:MAG: carbon-nitrogen hydrolase family protein, partial [Planctomycetota bacterium]
MATDTLTVALISDVFPDESHDERLRGRLAEARALGATLAVLPEIPLNPWSPATKEADDADAEPPGGPRHRRLAAAARDARLAVVGGAIVRDPETGSRKNTALVMDDRGELVGTYCKAHIPDEPGFWEIYHYDPGTEPPAPFDALGFPFGVQICSDINRPEGCHILGARGALAVLAPRATEAITYQKWRPVFIANALTSGLYVLSVNRPAPELGVLIAGPSIAVAPDGRVLLETTDPVATVTLRRDAV